MFGLEKVGSKILRRDERFSENFNDFSDYTQYIPKTIPVQLSQSQDYRLVETFTSWLSCRVTSKTIGNDKTIDFSR